MDLNRIRKLSGLPEIAEKDLSPLSQMDPTGEQPAEMAHVSMNEEPFSDYEDDFDVDAGEFDDEYNSEVIRNALLDAYENSPGERNLELERMIQDRPNALAWYRENILNQDEQELDFNEAFDLNNGYGSETDVEGLGDHGRDYFPSGQTSTAPKRLGPSAAKSGNNPMSAKQFTEGSKEIHESLVYKYRNFKKKSK